LLFLNHHEIDYETHQIFSKKCHLGKHDQKLPHKKTVPHFTLYAAHRLIKLMETNNLPKKMLSESINNQFLVLPLGFDANLVERIKSIFRIGHQSNRSYQTSTSDVNDNTDILLVNHDSPMALHKKDILLRTSCPNAFVIMVSQGPLANPPEYHIRGMLTASRLLGILDKLPLQSADQLTEKPDTTHSNSTKPTPEKDTSLDLKLAALDTHLQRQAIIPAQKWTTFAPLLNVSDATTTSAASTAPSEARRYSATGNDLKSTALSAKPLPEAITPISEKPTSVDALKAINATVNEPLTTLAETADYRPQTDNAVKSTTLEASTPAQTIAPIQETTTLLHTPMPVLISTGQAASAQTDGYRALVVDDSLAIQMSIKLKLQGIAQITSIDFADDGEIALEKSAATQYDLIFLDVMMPGIDGYETCSRLRKRPEYKKTPIIMVSGKTSPLDEVKGVMAGCTTYLTKPVEDQAFHKLSLRVLNWLADRKIAATTK
jgi:CheY-like chemotaxis protein